MGYAKRRLFDNDEVGYSAPSGSTVVTTVSPGGTLNYLTKWSPSGTELDDSPLYDNSGNIGLGLTTGANAKLHVKGTGDLLKIVDSSDNNVLLSKSDGSLNLGTNAFSPTNPDSLIRYRYSNASWMVGGLYLGADIEVHSGNIRNGDIHIGRSSNDALTGRIRFWADLGGAGEYSYGGQIYSEPVAGRLIMRGGLDGQDILGGTSGTTGINIHQDGFIGIRTSGVNTTNLLLAASTANVSHLRLAPGVAPSSPVDGDIYYINTNDRLMFRKNTLDSEVISASAVTTEVAVTDTTLTVTYNGTTYKLLAKA